MTVEGCDCEDCRARQASLRPLSGTAQGKDWSAMSLQSYSSAEECKQKHYWGIDFGANPVWEDGTPVVQPKPSQSPNPDKNGMVPLDGEIPWESGGYACRALARVIAARTPTGIL